MKEMKPEPGERIDLACDRLRALAPAFMVFNGIRVEAQPGDTVGVLCERWNEACDARQREYEATKDQAAKDHAARVKRLEEENERMRSVLEELNMNANNLLAGGLSWFTKRDFAAAVADRSKYALQGTQMPGEAPKGGK